MNDINLFRLGSVVLLGSFLSACIPVTNNSEDPASFKISNSAVNSLAEGEKIRLQPRYEADRILETTSSESWRESGKVIISASSVVREKTMSYSGNFLLEVTPIKMLKNRKKVDAGGPYKFVVRSNGEVMSSLVDPKGLEAGEFYKGYLASLAQSFAMFPIRAVGIGSSWKSKIYGIEELGRDSLEVTNILESVVGEGGHRIAKIRHKFSVSGVKVEGEDVIMVGSGISYFNCSEGYFSSSKMSASMSLLSSGRTLTFSFSEVSKRLK